MGGGIDPMAPKIDPPGMPSEDEPGASVPPGAAAGTAPPGTPGASSMPAGKNAQNAPNVDGGAAGVKAAQPKATSKTETLPWATTPAASPAKPAQHKTVGAAGAPAAGADTVVKKATAPITPCMKLLEAGCRETAKCAWLDEITLDDGAKVAAHCMARISTTAMKVQVPPKKDPGLPPATAAKMPAPAPRDGESVLTAPGVTAVGTAQPYQPPGQATVSPIVVMPPAAMGAPAKQTTPAATK
jgi:hypothetical protein